MSRVLILSGSSIGEDSAVTGYRHLVSKRMRCVFVTIHRKNLASTAREQPILSSYSHLDGASYGVSLTEQTMTSHGIRTYQDRISLTLMMKKVRDISHM